MGIESPRSRRAPPSSGRLGIRANLGQFILLVGVNALVGGMIGQERTIMPLLAERAFGLTRFTGALTFILAFGLVKAAADLAAGALSDRFGRKPVLVAGWLFGLPVPFLLIWAPSWGWVVAANALLGINQGLAWSATVIMKIDLAGPARRGLAMGLNEAAGYSAVAATALATGFIAQQAGLRPEPFFLGIAFAGLGLGLSSLAVRETLSHARREGRASDRDPALMPSRLAIVRMTTFSEPALSTCVQAGLVSNLNDAVAWGLLPLLFAGAGLSLGRIGLLTGLYPAVWGLGQLATGALSDRVGRKWLIACGMWVQAAALGVVAASRGFAPWAFAMALLGGGTAMAYPTLLAAIGDVAHPRWRASALGVYRSWRDTGFAVGALLAGVLADGLGPRPAVWIVAMITWASGLLVAFRMYETLPTARSSL